jgi:Ala-tRNA(Pro) deacylase
MAIALTLKEYLDSRGISYEVIPHKYSESSLTSADAAHVPGDCLAKSVVLEDDFGYLLAVLPANRKLSINTLRMYTHRDLEFAPEDELGELFSDCEFGAIPPVGRVYGMQTIIDDALKEQAEIYFEAGDHEALIRVSTAQFESLMPEADYSHFSRHI